MEGFCVFACDGMWVPRVRDAGEGNATNGAFTRGEVGKKSLHCCADSSVSKSSDNLQTSQKP